MKTNFCRAAISAASLSALFISNAMAQGSMAFNPADAADARATVPAVTYRSVFRETSLGIEQEKLDWRKANNDVGRFERGHVDILKSEEMDEKKNNPAPTQAPSNPPTSVPNRTTNSAPAHKH